MKKYLEILLTPIIILLMPVVLLIVAILGLFIYTNLPGNYITIYNDSDDTITNLTVISSNRDNINIGNIWSSNKVKIKIPDSFNETSVDIEYNIRNLTYTWNIIPYLILMENKNYSYRVD